MFDAVETELIAIAAENGYLDAQVKGDAGVCAIARFIFTHAILSGVTRWGYEGRWCYSSYDKAKAALDAWDGLDGTEPTGWHRHPSTGRRVDETGRVYVEW